MRFARIEVLNRDLEDSWVATMVGGRPGSGEWKDLCALWGPDMDTGEGGLRGLRLGIKGRVGYVTAGEAIDGSGGMAVDLSMRSYADAAIMGSKQLERRAEKGILDVDARWIVEGLCQMRALRWLEVNIEDEEVSKEQKTNFCRELGEKLSDVMGRRINVVNINKGMTEVEPTNTHSTTMVWGEPGDDYVWAAES